MSETRQEADALLRRALQAAKAGNRDQAMRYARAALQLEPRHVRGLHLLAKWTKDAAQKQALYRKIVAIEPNDAVATAYLAGVASVTPRRNRWVWVGVLVLLLGLGGTGVLLNVAARPVEPMPTELPDIAPTNTTMMEEVRVRPTEQATATERQAEPLSLAASDEPSSTPETTTTQMPRRATEMPTSTLVQFVLPMETPTRQVGQVVATNTVPFIAPPVQPTATQVSLVLPLPPTATNQLGVIVLPTTTSTPSATSGVPFDFVAEATSTRLPLFITATPAPNADLRTDVPPTDTQFEESPLSGGR
jgi:hypothetical protein